MEALKTATCNPAKYFGLLSSLGTVEPGKIADLVLLNANPLDDIGNAKKIEAVIVNGRYQGRSWTGYLLTSKPPRNRNATQPGQYHSSN